MLSNTAQKGTEWVLVGLANNSQFGIIREKMLKISEIERATINDRCETTRQLQESLPVSQARERALQQRVEETEAEVRQVERRWVWFVHGYCDP